MGIHSYYPNTQEAVIWERSGDRNLRSKCGNFVIVPQNQDPRRPKYVAKFQGKIIGKNFTSQKDARAACEYEATKLLWRRCKNP